MTTELEERRSLHDYPGFMHGKDPLAAKSAFSYIPTERTEPPDQTVFNSKAMPRSHSTFDRLFNKEEGYNNKLHRCDREHAKSRGLHVNDEETIKVVPTLASSEYGHRLDQFKDPPDRLHVRIQHVNTEFYRRNGINIDGNTEGS
ncbi:cilia- and flagella-associated protein 90-like [Ptychodera flava]|uniref:cilia- and flagella-associated protein 90-like n=1 Tax=Ptychodera flava TaxID=63121 RepID=UPI003969C7EF